MTPDELREQLGNAATVARELHMLLDRLAGLRFVRGGPVAPVPAAAAEPFTGNINDLAELAQRMPASLARIALNGMINRHPAEFARFAEHTRIAERFPPRKKPL